MTRRIVLFIFLMYYGYIFSQTIISGVVKDTIGNNLAMANVIVKYQDKILAYTITNEQGQFEIKVKTKDNFKVKATFLGYKPSLISVTPKNDLRNLTLVMHELKTQLNEVIINADLPETIQKKDTILYNLSKLTDGSESTLKDIVEKLPGMEIDDNGKIKQHGKPIDKVLINGKDFFNKQHQLATENINADMVKAIAFYKNFKTAFDTKTDEGARVLNVSLKDKYNNRITGNITASASYDKRCKLHPNFFNFRKNANIAFIGDFNSYGQQAITLSDYMTFTGGVKRYIKNVRSGNVEIDEENIPDFLLKEDAVADRKVYFGGLNLVLQKPKKYSFSGFYLVNLLQQTEKIASQKDYWDNLSINEVNQTTGDYFILTSYSHFKYRIAKNTILKWLVTGSLQNDTSNNSLLQNNQQSQQDLQYSNKRFGSNLSISQTFDNDIEWHNNFVADYNDQNKNRLLTANYPIFEEILTRNQNRIEHEILKKSISTNFITTLTKYLSRTQYSISLAYDKGNKDYQTLNELDIFKNNLQLKNDDYYSDFSFKYDNIAWHIKANLSYHHLNTELDNKTQTFNYFSPNIQLTYLFSLRQSISGGYYYGSDMIAPQKMLENNTITEVNVVNMPSLVKNDLLPTNQFYINYDNYLQKMKLYININGNYTQKQETVNSSIKQVTSNAIYLQYRLFPAENKWHANYLVNKKLTKHLLVSYKGNYSLENRIVYNNSGNRKLTVNMFYQTLKLYSKRKKSGFNYSFGLKYNLYQIAYQNDMNNKSYITYMPFVNLHGFFAKKYFWRIKSSYESYKNLEIEKYVSISPSIEYKMNKVINIALVGNNILNIGQNETTEWHTNEQYTEQYTEANLPGYISLQLKCLF